VYEGGEAAGHAYLIMPLIRGGSLRRLLKTRGNLPLAEALPILDGIARGLEHAHGRQVLHRDIKPENVLARQNRGLREQG
jgi:serine/threonine-protein kinase